MCNKVPNENDLSKFSSAMRLAYLAATNSRCTKKKVGACLIGRGRSGEYLLITSSFGDAPKGITCDHKEGKCPKYWMNWAHDTCWSVHAEERTLLKALSTDAEMPMIDCYDLTMLITHGPCDQCLKFMVECNVKKVVFDVTYKTDYSKWKGFIEIWNNEERLV